MAKGDVIIKQFVVAGTSGTYADGDVIGSETSVSGCVSANAGSARIFHVAGFDGSDVMAACDLIFSPTTASPAADSAAFAPSDANAELYESTVELAGWNDWGGARHVEWDGVKPIFAGAASTTVFLTVRARATIGTLTASTLKFRVYFMQDQ